MLILFFIHCAPLPPETAPPISM